MKAQSCALVCDTRGSKWLLTWSVKFLIVCCPKEDFERAMNYKNQHDRLKSVRCVEIVSQMDEWKPLQAWGGIQEAGMQSLEKQLPCFPPQTATEEQKLMLDLAWCWTQNRRASGGTIPDPLWIQCCLCILHTPVVFLQLRAQALVIENLFLFPLKMQAASESEPHNASWIKRRKALTIIQQTISGQQSRKN